MDRLDRKILRLLQEDATLAVADVAKKVGLDVGQIKKDKDSEEIQNLINANMESAGKLGVRGTPGFIIEDEIFRGYLTLDQMKEVIASKRSGS